jgi:hypothetical protein
MSMACSAFFTTDLDPEKIKPKRIYRRNRYFARNELSRLCLGVLRTAAGELLSTDDIAGRVIASKGQPPLGSPVEGQGCSRRIVCHCMLDTESGPAQESGTT